MLKPIWNPFSRFADSLEKRVDKLLRQAVSLGIFEAQRKVTELMQENLVIFNLYMEACFKGYKYLKRGTRKKLYRNAEKIGEIFLRYTHTITIKDEAVAERLKTLGVPRPSAPGDAERLRYLVAMMAFLSPTGEHYQYLEGASFGKLLKDISKGEKMIGDCNQIVTFYTYLYSLRYDIKELQIKILPEHVCLHYKGVDIEATSGSFAHYEKFSSVLPIAELISTNLLDVSDFRDKQIQVSPRQFLKGAQLAFNLSSERETVAKNLKIAYHNVAVESLKSDDFETAVFFLEKAGIETPDDQDFLKSIYHNAVLYYVKAGAFSKARYYSSKSSDSELAKYIDEKEGFYYFDHDSYERARELFQRSGNSQMVKATYGKEYNRVQARVAGLKDITMMKSHRSDYQKLLDLATKMEDSALADNIRHILNQL
jgi:hypothetical protein